MRRAIRFSVCFGLLIAGLALMFVLNVSIGSVSIALNKTIWLLKNGNDKSMEGNILWLIRIPRMLSAAILGGGLSISGYLLQTFFRNPISGPFVLGLSSGAKLFVGIFLLTALPIVEKISSPYVIVSGAFIGAIFSMLLVLAFAGKVRNLSMLLVIGMMIGYLCSAGTDLMITFADNNEIQSFTLWSMGSFAGVTWEMLKVSAWIVLHTVIVVFLLVKPLNAFMMGENHARAAGVNVKLLRIGLIVLSSILTACVTAFAGPISFVGIAVPHITKIMFKTSSPKVLVPGVFLTGSVFCLLCDLLARTVMQPTELMISTVTSVFGAPIVIWLMIKRRSDK